MQGFSLFPSTIPTLNTLKHFLSIYGYILDAERHNLSEFKKWGKNHGLLRV